jgi:hypothetical protein
MAAAPLFLTRTFLALVALFVTVHATATLADFQPPRTAGGKPDMSGVWQVLNTANYNVEARPAAAAMIMREGPVTPVPAKEVVALGAIGAVPASLGEVEGGEIPYQIWALKKRDENRRNWLQADTEIKCYLPGIPRASYMPYPFQIAHNDDALFFSYEYAGAVRNVYLSDPGEAPIDSWMGQSWVRWEGDTMVIETTGQHDQSWLDRAGNFHSELLKVTERFTRTSEHTMDYQVTLEDETVYTRPWTMSMPLYKRVGADDRIMQFNCVEFVEEMMYGHLRKEPLD